MRRLGGSRQERGIDPIGLHQVEFVGSGFDRPECVLTTAGGALYASDRRGGVAVLQPDGPARLIRGRGAPDGFLPNGIALLAGGDFLIANLGPDGGVWHLAADGTLTPRVLEVDGRALPPTNFVGIDRQDRIWITASTWQVPRERAFGKDAADGFIVLVADGRARIVADGVAYTNEAVVDATGRWLYVNETIGRRTSRFPILP